MEKPRPRYASVELANPPPPCPRSLVGRPVQSCHIGPRCLQIWDFGRSEHKGIGPAFTDGIRRRQTQRLRGEAANSNLATGIHSSRRFTCRIAMMHSPLALWPASLRQRLPMFGGSKASIRSPLHAVNAYNKNNQILRYIIFMLDHIILCFFLYTILHSILSCCISEQSAHPCSACQAKLVADHLGLHVVEAVLANLVGEVLRF